MDGLYVGISIGPMSFLEMMDGWSFERGVALISSPNGVDLEWELSI